MDFHEDIDLDTGTAGERVVRVHPGASGGDDLVREYVEQHKARCALKVLDWAWLGFGFLACLLGAGATNLLIGGGGSLPTWAQGNALVEFLDRSLGDPLLTAIGMAVGALFCSTLGVLRKPGGVPAGHEPFLALPVALLIYRFVKDALLALSLLTWVICVIYLGVIAYRLLAILIAARFRGLRVEKPRPPPGGWPVYTVLVPLYKETAVADKILKHLSALDYPRHRLDVKILLEADDPDTLAALESAGIPDWCEVVIVPDAQPKTKPRACNHGLARARGDRLVIFDAEDRPQPDQLKQAAACFQEVGENTACLQAQLAYHNHDQNLLTRWFALEYNVWFRVYLPGLVRMGAPIPLGGTSNHFKTEVLRELGGWDPFNVTEDCDLGIRLHQEGYRTAILDSVTWEEANSRLGNWLRQRSRWLKGYLITHLVWCRRPFDVLLRLNPWGVLSFLVAVFGVAGLAVLNIPLWIALAAYMVVLGIDMARGHDLWTLLSTRDESGERASWAMVYPADSEDPTWSMLSQILFVASVTLLLANVAFVMVNVLFGHRRGQRGLLMPAVLSPFYWVIISIGAWKGFIQMLYKPHYWEKTVHGLDAGTEPSAEQLQHE